MSERVCPPWVGVLLASPLRKLAQDPVAILSPYVQEGMTALDIGSAMGFFSLPLARLVGESGRVICVDLQEKMLASLEKRASREGLLSRIETRLCRADSLGLKDLGAVADFALAFAVVHEVPEPKHLFGEIHSALKLNGTFLFCEPRGHVNREAFDGSVFLARSVGFSVRGEPKIRRSHSALMAKS
ncbi:MAG TPA: methyltransferase domain-containing protein [Bacteroidota bacterium]|nr:methyltransferase domain-containing protein [Bacteroidota bacterium]